MDKKKILKILVVTMFAMFAADHIIDVFHWYYTVWWVDMVMHFFGGFWVALFFLYVFHDKVPRHRHLFIIISSVIFIGVGWEVFEWVMDLISKEPTIWSDTFSDLFFDVLGGLAAIYYNESNAKHR